MPKRKTVMRAVARARHAWQAYERKNAQKEGVPDSYRTVLMYLLRNPGANQRNIAEFAGVTTSAVNQAVKSMLEEDYLRKEVDASDKRNTKLYLTEKGTAVAENLFAKLDAADDAITAMIGPEKEAELIGFLEKLADFIREDLP